MNETEEICVITVDIKGSRGIRDRLRVQEELLGLLERINEAFEEDLLAKFMVTLGDECQGALKSPGKAYDILAHFRQELSAPFHCGVGIGSLETSRSEKVTDMDGTAFHRSRDALELAKKQTKGTDSDIIILSGNTRLDDLLNIMINLCFATRKHWTPRQRQVAGYLEEHPSCTYEELAKYLSVTKQAVSKVLKAANWSTVKEMERIVRSLLRKEIVIQRIETSRPQGVDPGNSTSTG